MVTVASPEDLLHNLTRRVVLWNPDMCALRKEGVHERIRQVLTSQPPYSTASTKAAKQFICGGPRAVEKWDDLDPVFRNNTREVLGFTAVDESLMQLHVVADSDSDHWASEEEEEVSDDIERSEEVSNGPLDAYFSRVNK